MARVRDVSRRSFLAKVAGAGLFGGAALVLGDVGAQARRRRRTTRMAVDADPRDPARPIAPPQQQPEQQPPPPPSKPGGDADSGVTADAQGSGRRPVVATRPSQAGRFVICPGNRRCPGRNR